MPVPDHVARKSFFIGPKVNFLDALKAITAGGGDAGFLDVASSFEQNLRSLMRTASLPFFMAVASVSMRYEIAERIQAITYTSEDDPSYYAKVSARIKERMEVEGEAKAAGLKVLDELEHARQDESFRIACTELLLQAVVLTWSTFEVLVSDVFVLLLNQNPRLATDLMRHDRTKKWFQPKELVTMLPDYDYNLSDRMGEVLLGWHRLDDIRAIRSVFEVLFPTRSKLQEGLQEKALWLLNQRRNLIVHRRAIVDRAYVENTGDSIEFGAWLAVDPDYIESSIAVVRDVGVDLLRAAMQY